jgi:hypothetical protein
MNLNFRDDERILEASNVEVSTTFLHVFQTKNKKKESSVFSHPSAFALFVLWDFREARQSVSHIMFCHLEVIIVKNFCLPTKTSVTFFVVLESFARGNGLGSLWMMS